MSPSRGVPRALVALLAIASSSCEPDPSRGPPIRPTTDRRTDAVETEAGEPLSETSSTRHGS